WQDEFTAIGTGALYYSEFTIDDVETYHPSDRFQTSTFWIIEADASNRLRLRGIDNEKGVVLVEYILDTPANPENRPYTVEKRQRASKPPVFGDGSSIKVSGLFGKYKATVPAASSTDGMPIVLYRAFVYDENGNEAASVWTLPRYYRAGEVKKVSLDLPKLEKGAYTVRVVAETAYGVRSDALETTVNAG
nr:hypothetical protein [Clostridiales bacterium]